MKMACFFMVCLCSGLYAIGQDAATPAWKSKTSRDIDLRDERGNLPRSAINDSSISRILVNALYTQKIKALHSRGRSYDQPATPDDLHDMFDRRVDTQVLANWITGYDPDEHTPKPFEADTLNKYRLYEEWRYHPAEGRMYMQTTQVVPMKRVYGDDGMYRGAQTTALIPYKDLISFLYGRHDTVLCAYLCSCIWQSYFSIDSGKAVAPTTTASRIWHAAAIRTIDLPEPADTQTHFLRNEHDDTLLSALIITSVRNKDLHAWTATDEPFSRRLTHSQLTTLIVPKVDTTIITDPISQQTITRIVSRDFNYEAVHQYKVLEEWTYEPMTGKTEIAIKGIAPVKTNYSDSGTITGQQTLFWIQFADLQQLLARTEPYHPGNTFALRIWDSYIKSDARPVLVSDKRK